MSALMNSAKGWYQTAKAILPERWAQARFKYDEAVAIRQVTGAICGRFQGRTSGKLNFIMAVPVVNWETALVEHARGVGACHHIQFAARGFFGSSREWEEWRASNAEHLEAGFNAAYREDDINVLFLYLSEFHIDPAILGRFRRKNVIIVHFNWDDRLHYTSSHKGQSVGVRKMAKAADLNLTMAVGPMCRYVGDNCAVFYWDGIVDELASAPVLPAVEFDRVLFFGSRYGFRETLIGFLQKKGLPLDVYGSGWGTEFISYERLAHAIPRYALNLGVSTIGYTRSLSCVKGRDIEVPSAGGLYLTNVSAEVARVYVPGEEILVYKSMADCYEQSCRVLENPERFAEVRRRGALKGRAYSWPARFQFLSELIWRVAGVDGSQGERGPGGPRS